MSVYQVFGLLAGVVSVIDGAPYIRDTVMRRTRPHRGTWLIWSVLAVVAFAAQIAQGGAWSLIMVGTQAVLTTIIWLLSIRFGVGGVSAQDRFMMGIAGLGLVGWALLSSPLLATVSVVIADTLGVLMMLPKTWTDPRSETLSTFALAALAGALSAVAVGELDVNLLLYPSYFAIANGAIATIIAIRRRRTA